MSGAAAAVLPSKVDILAQKNTRDCHLLMVQFCGSAANFSALSKALCAVVAHSSKIWFLVATGKMLRVLVGKYHSHIDEEWYPPRRTDQLITTVSVEDKGHISPNCVPERTCWICPSFDTAGLLIIASRRTSEGFKAMGKWRYRGLG